MNIWQSLIKQFNQQLSAGIQPIELVDAIWLAAQWGHFDEDSARLDSEKPEAIEPSSPTPSSNQEIKSPEPQESHSKTPSPEQHDPPSDNIFNENFDAKSVHVQPRDDYFEVQLPQETQKKSRRYY
jgi:hypothetical protein